MNIQKMVSLFPEVKGRRFDDLVADVKAHGLVEPIVKMGDDILDGRARLRACKLAKVEPRFIQFAALKFKGTADEYLWSVNLQRRHLTGDQRAVLIFEWEKALKADAKARQLPRP